MTTVQPSRTMMFVVTWVTSLFGQGEAAFTIDVAVGQFGMDFHADQAVAGNERPQPQQRADVEELDALRACWFRSRVVLT